MRTRCALGGDPGFHLFAGGALHGLALFRSLAQPDLGIGAIVPRDGRFGVSLDAGYRLLDGGIFAVFGTRCIKRLFHAHGGIPDCGMKAIIRISLSGHAGKSGQNAPQLGGWRAAPGYTRAMSDLSGGKNAP